MGLIVVLVIIYVGSVFGLETKFADKDILNLTSLMICFCPILNTILFVMYMFRDAKEIKEDIKEIKESLREEKKC